MEVEIVSEYNEDSNAEIVAKAVAPDNSEETYESFIETKKLGNKVVSHIKCERKLTTLIATIDDLLFCISTAERVIKTTRRLDENHAFTSDRKVK